MFNRITCARFSRKFSDRKRELKLLKRKQLRFETRALLASDITLDASAESHQGFDFTLTSDGTNLKLLETKNVANVIKSYPIADLSSVLNVGSDQGENLTIDVGLPATIDVTFSDDRLRGPSEMNVWTITGENAATLNTQTAFTCVGTQNHV